MVSIPVWQLLVLCVTLFLGFLGFVFAGWKIIGGLQNRLVHSVAHTATKKATCAAEKADDNEKALLTLRAELPLEYVRREDWIRNQTIIEAKLDALAAKLDKGGRSGC